MPEAEVIRRTHERTTSLARLDPQALISQALEQHAGIETLERLVALAKEVRAIQAEEAWHDAMAEFQSMVPQILKTRKARIRTRTGPGYEYSFAPLEDIKPEVDPVAAKCGLSTRWITPVIERDRVVVECLVSHRLGHTESSGQVAMPILQGGSEDGGANPMQRVGIALMYAKRNAYCNALGIVPERDSDGAGDGSDERQAGGEDEQQQHGAQAEAPISEPQVKRLWAIARGQGWSEADVHALVKDMAGVEHVHEVPRGKYDPIVDTLKTEKKTPQSGGGAQQQRLP